MPRFEAVAGPIYQAASDAEYGIKAIIYFLLDGLARVEAILKKLKLLGTMMSYPRLLPQGGARWRA